MKTIGLLLCLVALSMRAAEPTNMVTVAKAKPATNAPALSPLAALDLQIAQLEALQEKTWAEYREINGRVQVVRAAKQSAAPAEARLRALQKQAMAYRSAIQQLEVKRLALAPNDNYQKRAAERGARMEKATGARP